MELLLANVGLVLDNLVAKHTVILFSHCTCLVQKQIHNKEIEQQLSRTTAFSFCQL